MTTPGAHASPSTVFGCQSHAEPDSTLALSRWNLSRCMPPTVPVCWAVSFILQPPVSFNLGSPWLCDGRRVPSVAPFLSPAARLQSLTRLNWFQNDCHPHLSLEYLTQQTKRDHRSPTCLLAHPESAPVRPWRLFFSCSCFFRSLGFEGICNRVKGGLQWDAVNGQLVLALGPSPQRRSESRLTWTSCADSKTRRAFGWRWIPRSGNRRLSTS